MSLNSRSIVAALMLSSFGRITVSSTRWPFRSSAGTSIWNNAFSRLPHTQSEASQSTIRLVALPHRRYVNGRVDPPQDKPRHLGWECRTYDGIR